MRAVFFTLLLAAPPTGEDHFGVYDKGRRVGTVSDAVAAHAGGYVYTSEAHVRHPHGALPAPTHTTVRAAFDGRPPFPLRLATYAEFGRTAARTVSLERTAAGYDTVVSQAGETHRFPSAVGAYSLRDLIAEHDWLRGDPPAGATLPVTDLNWAEARPEPLTLRSLGRVGSHREVEGVTDRGRAWLGRYDPVSDRPVGFTFPSGVEFRAEPPAPWRPLDEPDPLPDLLAVFPTDRPLGPGPHPWLRLTLRGYTGADLRPGPGQAVEPRGGGVWACRLGAGEGEPRPVTPEDERAARAETPRFPYRHPKVMELARRAVVGARTPAEQVERLVRFVHGHVRYELEETPELFELVRTRRGNCQSFALLFVALARAAGLPAREVNGLMYAGDESPGFGHHRWAEVALGGAWHPVDPTAGLAELDATYLRTEDWTEGMTFTVDEVAWRGGLRGLSVRGVLRWLGASPAACVGAALLVVVVVYRVRRQLRAGPPRGVDEPPQRG